MARDASTSARSAGGEATYERILDAATSLFIEQGYEGTPMSRVAKSAGLTTPALYWHFGSKEELYLTVVKRGYIQFLDELLARTIGDSSEERLQRYVRAFVEMQLRDPAISMKYGYQQLRDALPEERRAELDAVEAAWVNHLKEILLQGRADGAFSFGDLELTTSAIITLCEYVFTWFKQDGRLSAQEVANIYVEFARRAVGV
jgi:AcrR family transcriptional regulator